MSMRASRSVLGLLAFAILVAATPAKAPRSPVKLHNGPNKVDFAGDGSHGLVMKAHRENGNAHSFESVSFYLLVRDVWNIVPVDPGEAERDALQIAGGADCVLHDFRLLVGSKDLPAELVLADRALVDGFVEDQEVTFTFYSLVKDNEGIGPTYYFRKDRTESAKKRYCDVEEAFKEELQY
jgi:hypothetical protein